MHLTAVLVDKARIERQRRTDARREPDVVDRRCGSVGRKREECCA
jgi:hypothetical protein